MNKKTRSTENEKWRHERTSVEIAWTNEQKEDLKWLWRHMVVKKSRRRNKKNKEKSKNSPSYRWAAIKNVKREKVSREVTPKECSRKKRSSKNFP